MLGIKRIQCVIKEYDYEIIDKIYISLTNGKEYCIKYSTDNFIGYSFTLVKEVFELFNDLLEKVSTFAIVSPIICLSNKQHMLVNKKINSLLSIYLEKGNCIDLNISTLFEKYEKDVDFYIRANDMILNILEEIRSKFFYGKGN